MSTVALADPAPAKPELSAKPVIELWFRRVLLTFAAVAALGIIANFAVLLWAQNEFTQPESVVAAQTMMLARHGTLYYGLKTYPYTVMAYMPIFYLLDSLPIRAGLPPFLGARLISFAAYLVLIFLCWRIAYAYTRERYCAWIAAVLMGSTSLLLTWGTTGQVDTLAVMFAVAAFERFSAYWVRPEKVGNGKTLLAAGALALAALFTKQTALACPAAIFCALLVRDRKTALRFGGGLVGVAVVLIALLNGALHGRFLANTVMANLNPIVWDRLWEHVHYLLLTAGQMLLLVMFGIPKMWRKAAGAVLLYLGFACLMWLVTAPKLGSDSNYQIETTVLLAICSAIALHSLDFFRHIFSASRAWVTLLQIPLALHPFLNFRIIPPTLIGRVVKEQLFRRQVAALSPYLAGKPRVISPELNALVRAQMPLEVEPLIYTLLVGAGRIDPEPVRRDLAAAKFRYVFLFSEPDHPIDDPEIPSLPVAQLKEVRDHYKLVAHVPGPYLNGVYVYQARDHATGKSQ